MKKLQRLAGLVALLALFAMAATAQTAALEGVVKGEDGKPLKGAVVILDRKDIKGTYKPNPTDKKGRWFHAGLPLGTYDVTCIVDGKTIETFRNVKTRLGDPLEVEPFDLSKMAARRKAMEQAVATGKVTEELSREMSKEEKAAFEKSAKERAASDSKKKELNDAFNTGMEALKAKNYAVAIEAFDKAAVVDPKQDAIWANKAAAHVDFAGTKTGDEQVAELNKGLEAYAKALELKPENAGVRNNYGLALARAKKYTEAQEECDKSAQLDPTNAGRCYYNLGATLVNVNQVEAASIAFQKAISADPTYADAYYQYGNNLLNKATTSPDGKPVFVAGTAEAFQKYLELKPDGQFAEAARGILAAAGTAVQTEYKNPNAPAAKKSTTKTKK